MMTQVSKAQFKTIRAAFEAKFGKQFEEFFAEHGLSAKLGMGHYGTHFDLVVEAHPVSADGTVQTPAAQAWKSCSSYYPKLEGLKVGDKWTINRNGRTHRIEFTGYNPRARKNSMLFKMDGVDYHCPTFNMEHYWSIKQDYVPAGSNG